MNVTMFQMALLLAYPNVLVTSYQVFFTREAMQVITEITLGNIQAFECGEFMENEICYQCMTGGCDCNIRELTAASYFLTKIVKCTIYDLQGTTNKSHNIGC